MRFPLTSARIENYKSFLDSGRFPIDEGFTVVMGKNNVGKTALTEAIGKGLSNHPHRPFGNRPYRPSEVTLWSRVTEAQLRGAFPGEVTLGLPTCGAAPSLVHHLDISWTYSGGPSLRNQPCVVFEEMHEPGKIVVCGYSLLPQGGIQIWSSARDVSGFINQPVSDFEQGVYRFSAERLKLSRTEANDQTTLNPDASNLPSVLHNLYNRRRHRFDRLIRSMRRVFDDVYDIDAPNEYSVGMAEVRVWIGDPATEDDGLAIPLADCGTGVGQVLAMLLVAVESTEPRLLVIDEPQSFLHPGAIRSLFDELRIIEAENYVRHQYLVSTHSTVVIDAAAPERLLQVVKERGRSRVEVVDRGDLQQMYFVLEDVGARLSDVFGADAVLWVEGQTEEVCFPMISRALGRVPLGSTLIRSVVGTGSFDHRSKELRKQIVDIYERLTTGIAVIPPAVGFIFDREERSEQRIAELAGRPGVHLLPRRLFENYLLIPGAIQSAMAQVVAIAGDATSVPTVEATEQALAPLEAAHLGSGRSWLNDPALDGSKVLDDLFRTFIGHPYIKTRNGPMLVEWILTHEPEALRPIAELIDGVLGSGGPRVSS